MFFLILFHSLLHDLQVIGQLGTVELINQHGDIVILYEKFNKRWTFNPDTVTKVTNNIIVISISLNIMINNFVAEMYLLFLLGACL